MQVPAVIGADELAARLDDDSLRVCDVRWELADPARGRREYGIAHIPNALFVDLETVLTGETGPGRHPLPSAEEFTTALGRLGIGTDHHVVAYDDAGGAIAARLWWMLRSIGHEHVSILDGGFTAWASAGHPVTSDVPAVRAVSYPAAAGWSGVVGTDRVREAVGRTPIVDARAGARYRGETEPVDPRPGHIPSAVNLAYAGNLDQTGRLLAPEALRARFQAVAGPDTIVYCGSGVTACHDILAMTVAGLPAPLLYEGSWSEWSADPDLPAASGIEEPDPS